MTEKNTVLITGASGGVGRATVLLFEEKGWNVVGVDRSDKVEEFPKDGLFIKADISNPDDIKRVYDETNRFSKQLNAVVNNAAYADIQTDTGNNRGGMGCCHDIQSTLSFSGFQAGASHAGQGRRRSNRECFIGTRHSHLEGYCSLCSQQRWIISTHAGHGD